MIHPWHSPAVLLLCVGTLLGFNFPLGKLAAAAGISPLAWSLLIAASASLILAAIVLLRRLPRPVSGHHLRYFLVTALVSYVLPNILVFSAIPRLGSGLVAVFYALSTLFTIGCAQLAGVKRSHRLELIAVGIGFIGTLMVVSARGEVGRPASLWWLGAGLLVPVSLAIGNVYRTIDWPSGAHPLWLAVGSNGAAALIMLGALVLGQGHAALAPLVAVPLLALAQMLVSAAMVMLFFQLQHVGGPVTLSQIGTVAAAVGVALGAFVMGETYPAIVYWGVAVILIGVSLTVMVRRISGG